MNTKQVVAVWPTLEMTYCSLFRKKIYNLIIVGDIVTDRVIPETWVLEVRGRNVFEAC